MRDLNGYCDERIVERVAELLNLQPAQLARGGPKPPGQFGPKTRKSGNPGPPRTPQNPGRLSCIRRLPLLVPKLHPPRTPKDPESPETPETA